MLLQEHVKLSRMLTSQPLLLQSTCFKLTIPIIDKTAIPDENNAQVCPQIYPHLTDKVIRDNNWTFRAILKAITGTESNHTAL